LAAQLTAYFDSADMADKALAQLKQNGIAFNLSRMPYQQYTFDARHIWQSQNIVSPDGMPYMPALGATLRLRIDSGNLTRARQILKDCSGREIKSGIF
jgi:hypothetical protein